GYSALDSGMAVSPRGFGALFAAFIVGRLIGVVDSRWLIAIGLGAMAFSGWIFSHMTLEVAFSSIILATILNGAASGLVFIPLSTTAMANVARERMGSATG